MSTIITKYSDYAIQSIEYFIESIESALSVRDLSGLTDGKIEIINVSKQHPLVTLMDAVVAGKNMDSLRSGIIPAISVTPGNPAEEGVTIGQGFKNEIVNSEYETIFRSLLNLSDKEIQREVLITKTQIELILAEYKRKPAGSLRAEIHEWRMNEDINISVWSPTPDVDLILGNLMDSIISDIKTGLSGDLSKVQNLKSKITKGLTNFNYGRVIFGSEYSLAFMNTYNNYTIYSDDVITGHELHATFETPG
jgi:hypothetical protein